jgi:hypothetical protein
MLCTVSYRKPMSLRIMTRNNAACGRGNRVHQGSAAHITRHDGIVSASRCNRQQQCHQSLPITYQITVLIVRRAC